MRAFGVVINYPGFDEFFRIVEVDEPMLVEAFVPHRSVEALDKSVLHRLDWLDELQLDAMLVGPAIKHLARELGAIVGEKTLRMASLCYDAIEQTTDSMPAQRTVDLNGQAF